LLKSDNNNDLDKLSKLINDTLNISLESNDKNVSVNLEDNINRSLNINRDLKNSLKSNDNKNNKNKR